MVKFTGGQRIDLLGIKKEDLPGVWADLGMPSGHAYTKALRTVKTCVGTEFCRYGTNDSTGLGIDLEKRFQGFEFPAKVKLARERVPAELRRVNRQGRRRDRHGGRRMGGERRRGGRRARPQDGRAVPREDARRRRSA